MKSSTAARMSAGVRCLIQRVARHGEALPAGPRDPRVARARRWPLAARGSSAVRPVGRARAARLRPSPRRRPARRTAARSRPRAARPSRRPAARRSCAARSARAAGPAGTAWTGGRSGPRSSARAGAADPSEPRSQSRSVSPGGADQSPDPSERTHITCASSAYAAHAARRSRVPGQRRRPGAAGVHPRPDLLPGRHPAGRPALAQRRVRERGHEHRPDRVQQPPPPAVAGVTVAVVAGVQADLDRRGAAHHLAAPRAAPVEEGLHGRVPRQVEHAARRAERIEAESRRARGPRRRRAARSAARSAAVARTHSASESAGSELSSSCPPGSVVSSATGRQYAGGRACRQSQAWPGCPGARSRSRSAAPKAATAAAIRSAVTGRAGSRASRTSHSSSTPTRRGGPVFRQMPWMCSAACCSAITVMLAP